MAAVRNTEVRDVLGAIVEEEGMDYEGWVILQWHGVGGEADWGTR
jgi:hypothetical protein